jgi:hypothetical protein
MAQMTIDGRGSHLHPHLHAIALDVADLNPVLKCGRSTPREPQRAEDAQS